VGLWVTAAERDAINRVLAGCPGEPLADSGDDVRLRRNAPDVQAVNQ
jgi:hypothetical protein